MKVLSSFIQRLFLSTWTVRLCWLKRFLKCFKRTAWQTNFILSIEIVTHLLRSSTDSDGCDCNTRDAPVLTKTIFKVFKRTAWQTNFILSIEIVTHLLCSSTDSDGCDCNTENNSGMNPPSPTETPTRGYVKEKQRPWLKREPWLLKAPFFKNFFLSLNYILFFLLNWI